MSYTENALVIHRVGSKEAAAFPSACAFAVIHRVGSKEGFQSVAGSYARVIHRVGSKEETSIEPLRVS